MNYLGLAVIFFIELQIIVCSCADVLIGEHIIVDLLENVMTGRAESY